MLGFYAKPADILTTTPTSRMTQTLALLERATPLTQSIPSELYVNTLQFLQMINFIIDVGSWLKVHGI